MSGKDAGEQYDPPQVEQISTESGPAVTAAGETGTGDTSTNPGVEWRPAVPPDHEEER